MNRIKVYGYITLFTAIFIAASMPIAFVLGNSIPVLTLLFYMAIAGTITSFLIMLAKGSTGRLKNILNNKNQFIVLITVGVLAFTLEPLGIGFATHYVSADLAAVIFRTWPIMLIVLAPIVIRERITRWDAVGVVIGFLGLGVTLIGGTSISLPLIELPFVGILLLVAFIDAFSTAITKRYNYELSSSIFVFNIISLLVLAPLAFYTGAWQLPSFTVNVIFAILFLGVLTQAVFSYLFYEAFRIVKTSFAGTAFIAAAFITMLLSVPILGEPIRPYYVLIAGTVIAGIMIQRFAPKLSGNFIVSKRHSKHEMPVPIYDVTSAFIHTQRPEIYKAMIGNGRVLAFQIDNAKSGAISKEMIDGANTDNCMLFTDKHHSVASQNELEFIREIIGIKAGDTLVMGSGDPELVSKRFADLNNIANNSRNSQSPV